MCVVVSPAARQLLHRVPACCCVANCTSSLRRELCEVSLLEFPIRNPIEECTICLHGAVSISAGGTVRPQDQD